MSVENAPPFVLDGPRPVPPRYRLLDAATIIEEPDPHWQAGAAVWSYQSDLPLSWNPCSTGTTRSKSTGGTVPLPEFGAYVVYQNRTCTARSIFSGLAPDASPDEVQQAYVDRVLQVFAATESYAVEREFLVAPAMRAAGQPYMGDSHVTLLASGAAVAPRIGMSYLADAVGRTGRDGLIHATPSIVTAWGLFRTYRDSEDLFTVEGTPIAEGDGYIDQAPDPRAAPGAGKQWAWASGPVEIRRSQPIIYPGNFNQAFDRATNTLSYTVERVYLHTWDTALQSAVLIDWTLTP